MRKKLKEGNNGRREGGEWGYKIEIRKGGERDLKNEGKEKVKRERERFS